MDSKLFGYSAYINDKSIPVLNGSIIANGEYVTFIVPKEFKGKGIVNDIYTADFDLSLTTDSILHAPHEYEKCNVVNVQEITEDVENLIIPPSLYQLAKEGTSVAASLVYAGCGLEESSLKGAFLKFTIKGVYKSAIQKEFK